MSVEVWQALERLSTDVTKYADAHVWAKTMAQALESAVCGQSVLLTEKALNEVWDELMIDEPSLAQRARKLLSELRGTVIGLNL